MRDKRKKILTVLGARPQFIKASVVSSEIGRTDSLVEVVVHTGQHFDANMSEVFFSELGMAKPTYHLDVHGGSHGAMTGRMLTEIEEIMERERPDAVLLYGDTNSTLAGALAAVKLHLPIAHVEAGLRSFNMAMPEEVNRILTDRISRWLFTPTKLAEQQLLHEGFSSASIFPVGDVMLDAALHHGERVHDQGGLLERLGLRPKQYILTTIHRAENTDQTQRLDVIVDAIKTVAKDLPVVWPLHPRTRIELHKMGRLEELKKHAILIEPIGYLDMVQLEKYAGLIATDSGGVQKEAFFYRVPCITLRDETEWVELVESGWNRLAPPLEAKTLIEAIHAALGSQGTALSAYGDGCAAVKIVAQLTVDLFGDNNNSGR